MHEAQNLLDNCITQLSNKSVAKKERHTQGHTYTGVIVIRSGTGDLDKNDDYIPGYWKLVWCFVSSTMQRVR